jgi:mRNA interferase HicA
MNGNEFERKIKKLGRKRGIAVAFDPGHGKGSHGRLYYGNQFTTLKDRRKEIGPGLLNAMLAQSGLSKADLENRGWRSVIGTRCSGRRMAGGSSASPASRKR